MISKRRHRTYIKKRDIYKSATAARKRARALGLRGIHSHGRGDDKRFMPGSSHQAYLNKVRKRK